MFNMKAKAYRKADALREKGYQVLTNEYRGVIHLIAEKGEIRHIAKYEGRKLLSLETSIKHHWHNIASYQTTSSTKYLKDFK